MTKVCSKCKEEKDIDKYSKDKTKKDRHQGRCKQCKGVYNKSWIENNPEKAKAGKKAWSDSHREEIKEKNKAFYKKNREREKARQKAYKENNPEKVKATQKVFRGSHQERIKAYRKVFYRKNREEVIAGVTEYRENNPEKVKVWKKTYRENNLNARIADGMRARVWKVLKGVAKSASILELLGCSIEYLKEHLESQFQDGMTWENYGFTSWHMDHIIPCASFDLTDKEQQRQCFHYSNLQPLWATDNLRKSNKQL